MQIQLLLGVLGMVIGTLGFVVEKNDTTVVSSNTTESILHDDKVSTIATMKFNGITKNEEIENKWQNNSDKIIEQSSLTNSLFNDTTNQTISYMNNIKKSIKIEDKPKNIILVMVEGIDIEKSWKKLNDSYSFTVQDFFQSCKIHENSYDTSTITVSDNKNCECYQQLKSNISDLINYARSINGMNVAIVSEDDYTVPTTLNSRNSSQNYHKSKLIGIKKDFNVDETMSDFHSKNINDYHQVYMKKKLISSSSSSSSSSSTSTLLTVPSSKLLTTSPTPHISIKYHENMNQDRIWRFFDIMTKIRLDFIKNLFDSLHVNPVFNRHRNSRKLLFHSPTENLPLKFISKALSDLQRIPNDKGFFMVINVPHYELSALYDSIQSQTSTKDSLIIISGLDTTHGKQSIPYVANGPGSNYFKNLQTICDLFSTIKIILNHCRGICTNNDLSSTTLLLPAESFIPKKRFARSDEDEASGEDDKNVENTSENDSSHEDADNGGNDDDDASAKSSANTFYVKHYSMTCTISIVSPIIALWILYT